MQNQLVRAPLQRGPKYTTFGNVLGLGMLEKSGETLLLLFKKVPLPKNTGLYLSKTTTGK